MMGAWEMLAMVLFLFPPTAIGFVACLVKLFAVLEEKKIGWGKAFGIAAIINGVLLLGWLLYGHFSGAPVVG